MALVADEMKAKFRITIHNGLKREFGSTAAKGSGYPPVADEFWVKLSNAIADIAVDIVNEMHNNAQVAPGQQVVAGINAGATVSPGKIV